MDVDVCMCERSRMNDWIELEGYPRVFASQCAPWISAVRLIDGEPELGPASSIELTAGVVQPVPNSGWLVVAADRLRLVHPDGGAVDLFTLPAGSAVATAVVRQVGFDVAAPSWLVELGLSIKDAPMRTVALVFTEGALRNQAYLEAEGVLRIGASTVPLAADENGYGVGYAAGPAGDLAMLLDLREGLSLLWSPPLDS